jgi:hypothetical protein
MEKSESKQEHQPEYLRFDTATAVSLDDPEIIKMAKETNEQYTNITGEALIIERSFTSRNSTINVTDDEIIRRLAGMTESDFELVGLMRLEKEEEKPQGSRRYFIRYYPDKATIKKFMDNRYNLTCVRDIFEIVPFATHKAHKLIGYIIGQYIYDKSQNSQHKKLREQRIATLRGMSLFDAKKIGFSPVDRYFVNSQEQSVVHVLNVKEIEKIVVRNRYSILSTDEMYNVDDIIGDDNTRKLWKFIDARIKYGAVPEPKNQNPSYQTVPQRYVQPTYASTTVATQPLNRPDDLNCCVIL